MAVTKPGPPQAPAWDRATWLEMLGALPAHVTVVDRGLRVLYVNNAYPGVDLPAILGRSVTERVSVERRDAIASDYEKAFRTGAPVTHDVPWTDPKGGTRWARTTVTPFRLPGGAEGAVLTSIDITDTKRVLEELRRSEERWRSLVEGASDTVVVVDRDYRLQFVNRLPEGIPQETVLGRDVREDVLPEWRPFLEEQYAKVWRGKSVTYDLPARNPSGEGLVWHRASMGPLRRDGAIVGAVAVSTDITEQKRREERLMRSEERYRLMVENVQDYAIFMIDPEGRVASWNAGAERLKGYKAEEVIGQHFSVFFPPEDREEKPARELEQAARLGRVEDEGWRVRKDGSRFWANVVATALRDGHGKLRGFAKVTRDLTEHRNAEQRLRRSEELLHEAQRIANVGSWQWNVPEDRVTASPELARICGLPKGQPLEGLEGLLRTVHPDDREAVRGAVERTLDTGADHEVEFRVLRPDGGVRLVRGRGHVERGPDGQPARLVSVAQDVTEQRRIDGERRAAESKLRELERLKEIDLFKTQFINNAAHELATPLTPIQLQLDLLLSRERDMDPDDRRALALVARNMERLRRLVSDVLEVARMGAGRLTVEREPLDVGKVVVEAADAFREASKQAGLELVVEAPEGLAAVGDANRLTQVLFNLLGNALKFTPAGGRVEVRAAREGEEVVVQVRDTGIGIATEDLPRLFQPFSQASAGARQGGTGLGLYISKGIVELHDGRIWAQSPGPGQGATVAFALPAA